VIESGALIPVWTRTHRLWHWALAALVMLAWLTPNTYDGAHRLAGYAVMVLIAVRLILGFCGARYSRFRTLPRRLRAAPFYLLRLFKGTPGRYLGLNPAGAAMLVVLLVALVVSTVTGAMQVTVSFFGIWWVEDTHALVSNALMGLVVIHVAGTIVTSLVQRQNLVLAMITGRKRLKSEPQGDQVGSGQQA
jgi:cytochrome b